MKILPVLDLKGGVVVRGVAGRREEYRPIASKWCEDPSPASVARGLRATFGFDECYVADLDAIGGDEPDVGAYRDVVASEMQPWIDLGCGSPALVGAWNDFLRSHASRGRIVVGLESLADVSGLECILADVRESIVFSLDMQAGRPLTKSAAWGNWSPDEIAAHVVACGVTSMIVLDLAGVGVGQGVPTLDLCRRLRAKYPHLELISGGGVRGVDDLKALRDAGCNAALVASALHDGRLTPELIHAFERDGRR